MYEKSLPLTNGFYPALLKEHAGEFVVLEGQEPVHFDTDYERALDWAFEHSAAGQVFVKQVVPDGAQLHFTRDIGAWQKGN
jgi:hypothetical protein